MLRNPNIMTYKVLIKANSSVPEDKIITCLLNMVRDYVYFEEGSACIHIFDSKSYSELIKWANPANGNMLYKELVCGLFCFQNTIVNASKDSLINKLFSRPECRNRIKIDGFVQNTEQEHFIYALKREDVDDIRKYYSEDNHNGVLRILNDNSEINKTIIIE